MPLSLTSVYEFGFFKQRIFFCKRRGWKFIDKAQKEAVKHLIAVIEPLLLKYYINHALKLVKDDRKNDFFWVL